MSEAPIPHLPKNTQIASRIIWATIILSIVSHLIIWGNDIMGTSVALLMNKEYLIPMGITLLVIIFQIWVVKAISTGDKSARLLFVFLFIMSLRAWLPTIVEDFEYSFFQSIFHIGLSIAQIVVMVLLFSKESNAWFNAQHALKTKKA